jgi:hypothetical protein
MQMREEKTSATAGKDDVAARSDAYYLKAISIH